ncbi:MAG: hypothetical protein HZB56_13495 [Deltaproteobacteria bacterium]|nr:hypothetical protein [Deltaproteobacteria bacterium]
MIASAFAALLLCAEPAPPPEPAPAPAPDPDAELLQHLEELEQLDLLRNLELFDPGEEEPGPKGQGKG